MRVTPFELWTRNTLPFGAAKVCVSRFSARSAHGMPGSRLRSSALKPCVGPLVLVSVASPAHAMPMAQW